MKSVIVLLLAALSLGAAGVVGSYSGTVDVPAGTFQVTLTLEEKGGEIGGTITTEGSTYTVQKGKLAGNKLTFEVLADQTYAVECTVENDRLSGDVKPAGGGAGKIDVTRAK